LNVNTNIQNFWTLQISLFSSIFKDCWTNQILSYTMDKIDNEVGKMSYVSSKKYGAAVQHYVKLNIILPYKNQTTIF